MKSIKFKRDVEFEFEDEEVSIVKIEKGKVYQDLYGRDIEECYTETFDKYNVSIEHEKFGEMSIEINPNDIEIF